MNNKIEKHPSILLQNEIADICKPLAKLNISYFTHVNIRNNKFSAITNNPGFHRHYLYNKQYNADIHWANHHEVKDYFMWDLVKRSGRELEMDLKAAEFGVKHIFTLIDANRLESNYYHFATHLQDSSINHTYLTNIDLLKMFITHFHHGVNSEKQLKQAYNIQFDLDDETGKFRYDDKKEDATVTNVDRKSFISDLSTNCSVSLSNRKTLSAKQLHILYWLHQGKTISDISALLNIAEVTVNKHLSDIKMKTGCYTQFQLGELFSKLLSYYPDWVAGR